MSPTAGGTWSTRSLNRATLARQLLLARSDMPVADALYHLVGLQAQTPHTAYTGLWSRLEGFRPGALSDLLATRAAVRIALMRSTIHLVTAADAWGIRPLVQPAIDRVQQGTFGRRMAGIDPDELAAVGRAFVDVEPRTFRALGDHLLERWPDRDRFALEQGVRAVVPLVQVPPRGLWGRSGPIAHTSLEAWLGPRPPITLTIDDLVRRYLRAFGPASVMDAQAWCGVTRLREVFDRLRPELVTGRAEDGRELFDLPDAPRPEPETTAPPRFLYDFDNMLLSYADRSRTGTPEVAAAIVPETQEPISTFLIDGFVAGTWKARLERGHATLSIRPVVPIRTTDQDELAAEGDGLLAFLASTATTREVRFDL